VEVSVDYVGIWFSNIVFFGGYKSIVQTL